MMMLILILALVVNLCCSNPIVLKHTIENIKINANTAAKTGRKVKILQTTDIHGWVNGHPHIEDLDTDFGDFRSLIDHMTKEANEAGIDLLIFDSGDIVEGTGLSDATPVHGRYILKVLESIPYTALTMGNHDLGRETTVSYIKNEFLPNIRPETMLTTNTFDRESGDYYATPYRLHTTNNGLKILLFGFIFDFEQAATNADVHKVEDVVKTSMFLNALNKYKDLDMIIITMHIAPDQNEIDILYKAIRDVYPNLTLIFLAGHSHQLNFKKFDNNCYLYQSKSYFYYVANIDLTLSKHGLLNDMSYQFHRTSKTNFYNLSNTNQYSFDTTAGLKLKSEIKQYYQSLKLDEIFGCSSQSYHSYGQTNASDSLYGLYFDKIMPEFVYKKFSSPNKKIYISSYGFLRDSIYQGNITRNDVISIIPFDDAYNIIVSVTGTEVLNLLATLKNDVDDKVFLKYFGKYLHYHELKNLKTELGGTGGRFIYSDIEVFENRLYDIVASEYDAFQILQLLASSKYKAKVYGDVIARDILGLYIKENFKC